MYWQVLAKIPMVLEPADPATSGQGDNPSQFGAERFLFGRVTGDPTPPAM